MLDRISKRKLLTWSFALVICGALIVLVVLHTKRPSASLAYKHIPGECLIYQIDYKSFSVADFRVLFEGLDSYEKNKQIVQSGLFQSFKSTVQGELVKTVLDKKADSVLVAYRLQNPLVTLEVNEQEAALQAEIISTALSLDIFAELSLQSRVLFVWFDPDIDSFSQNFARALLAQTQFVLPSASTSGFSQWEVQEDDPNGHYIARYKFVPDKSESVSADEQAAVKTFRKTKIRYLIQQSKTKPAESTIPTTVKPEGSLEALFDVSGGYLASLSGSEMQTIIMASKSVACAENSLHLKFLRKEVLPSSELSAMQEVSVSRKMATQGLPLSASISEEEREASIHRSELNQATSESLLADLAKAEEEGRERDTSLYLKFKALIYLHPETCDALGKILATALPKSLTMRIISGALGVVGHPQAQVALVNAIRAHLNDSTVLLELVQNLGLVDSPTILTENTLRDLAANSKDKNVHAAALLALGNMARNLSAKSPARADKIVDWVIEEARSSSSEERMKLFLLVLGNSGSVRALPTIIRFVDNPSPVLRSAAVSGLRWIGSSKADNLLAQVLTSDPSTSVRVEAAFALSFRKLNSATFQAQKKAFLEDEAVLVRLAVLKNLWQVHKSFTEVCRLVRDAAINDPSKDVRKVAAEIIARYPKDYFDR